jgi:hypothetical protein
MKGAHNPARANVPKETQRVGSRSGAPLGSRCRLLWGSVPSARRPTRRFSMLIFTTSPKLAQWEDSLTSVHQTRGECKHKKLRSQNNCCRNLNSMKGNVIPKESSLMSLVLSPLLERKDVLRSKSTVPNRPSIAIDPHWRGNKTILSPSSSDSISSTGSGPIHPH